MTDASNGLASNGLYIWQADNLITATQSVNGHWADASLVSLTDLKSTRIITDTRKIETGDIFLAIVGEKFDAHNFIQTAVEKGAVAVIVNHQIDGVNIPQLIVDDTRIAFGQLAAYRRQQHQNLKVIAITGSSGKTTVKEMLRSIFMQAEKSQDETGSSTLVTRGNLNNDFGVPMMLLELADYHRYAVLELGANHVGEIAYTANLVKPDVACILNIGTAHLGEFGGRDNIAKAKAEIYQSLHKNGTAVVPFDDDYSQQLITTAQQYTAKVTGFSWHSNHHNIHLPQATATEVKTTALQSQFKLHFELGSSVNHQSNAHTQLVNEQSANKQALEVEVTLPMAGQHNVSNALAAAACAYAIGIAPDVIAKGLAQVKSTKGRLARQTFGKHQIIDDTYNANPNSVKAAADVLSVQQGYKVLVLGDIGELGDASICEHTKLGKVLATKNIDALLCVGEFAKHTVAGANEAGMKIAHAFATKAELLVKLQQLIGEADSKNESCAILFKGSRTMTMETLIDDLI